MFVWCLKVIFSVISCSVCHCGQCTCPCLHRFILLAQSAIFLAHLSTTCSRGAFRVVRGPSCVVNNFFKHLLLPNRLANLDQTWQECSLGGPLQKLFTKFDSIKNSGCHGNEIEFFKQFFKNFFSETAGLNLKGKSTSFSKCCFSKVQLSISKLVIFLFFKKCLKSTLFQF